MIHTIKEAEGKTFKDYKEAINYLILLMAEDDELSSFVNTEIEARDYIKIGDEQIPAIDVFDFL